MGDSTVKPDWKGRINRKILILIAVVILAGVGTAAVQEYMKDKYLRLVQVEKYLSVDSEKGKSLIATAEKTLESEGLDTRYLYPESIVEFTPFNPSSPLLRFKGIKTFYSAKVYTSHNLTSKGTGTVFAADLSRYNIDNQSYGEIWEYGKNYSLNASNKVLEVIDTSSDKVKLRILNYSAIQDDKQTDAIINEINGKFELAQREFRIGRGEPAVIIDAPGNIGNLKNTDDLLVEVIFCDSKVCAMRMEEKSRENESNGWVEYNVTRRIKYLNASEW